jgi:3-hydroxyacyl-CoA dehydrogenase
MDQTTINRVAVIGTGVIGASWVTYFLARGLSVAASDPAPNAEAKLRDMVEAQWGVMQKLGLAADASVENLSFHTSPESAVEDSGFVQENGPELLSFKRELFSRLDEAASPRAILASSTSTIMVSEFQDACKVNPARVILGHPFNPPHLIPLVEVAGGAATAPGALGRAMDFYRKIGKHPVLLKKEIKGHIANRLQAALWREAFGLVASGVAGVADIDAAIAHGPGLRWALLGPFLNLHLSGGEGGIRALFKSPLWQATEALWADLGAASVDATLARSVEEGVKQELSAAAQEDMIEERDNVLLALLALKAKAKKLP